MQPGCCRVGAAGLSKIAQSQLDNPQTPLISCITTQPPNMSAASTPGRKNACLPNMLLLLLLQNQQQQRQVEAEAFLQLAPSNQRSCSGTTHRRMLKRFGCGHPHPPAWPLSGTDQPQQHQG
jgi:hypothetical protein